MKDRKTDVISISLHCRIQWFTGLFFLEEGQESKYLVDF